MLKARFSYLFDGKRPIFALAQSLATQGGVIFLNIATGALTARLLGPAGRGAYAAITTWPLLMATIALSGIGNALIFNLRKSPDRSAYIVGSGILIVSLTSAIATVTGLIFVPYFLQQYPHPVIILAELSLLCTFLSTYQMFMKQIFAGIGRYNLFNISNIAPPAFYLIILAVSLLFWHLTVNITVYSLIFSTIFAAMTVFPFFLIVATPRFTGVFPEARRLIAYSARAWIMDIVNALSTSVDRLILIPLIPASDLGFYVVAYSFSRIAQLPQPAINSIILSNMSARNEREAKQLHDYAFRFSLLAMVLGCAISMALARPLLVLMYGRSFGNAALLFDVLICEAALSCLAQVTFQLFLGLDRPGFGSMVQSVSFVTSGVLIALLVPAFGAFGAALGILTVAIIRLVLLLWGIRYKLKLPLPRPWLDINDIAYLRDRLS